MNETPNAQGPVAETAIIEDELMISRTSFEIDMSEIQRDIGELTEAIDGALTVWGDYLVEPDAIAAMARSDVRECELALSRSIRSADELRRKLNRDYKVPLDIAKQRYDELMNPVIALRDAYKQRRLEIDEEDKRRKLQDICARYETLAPHLALPVVDGGEALVPFERIFSMYGAKWLNKGADMSGIERELSGIVASTNEAAARLEEAHLAHETEARAVFWQTLDVEAAFARERELCALEERQAALERKRLETTADAEQQRVSQLAPETNQPEKRAEPESQPPAPESSATRKPRVMIIDGATDDECRQIAALCKSLGITGVFKGPAFYDAIKPLISPGAAS